MFFKELIIDKLVSIKERYKEIERKLVDPLVLAESEIYQKFAKEHAELGHLVRAFNSYRKLEQEFKDSCELIEDDDQELVDLAKLEKKDIEEKILKVRGEIEDLLLFKDPNDDKNVIVEIRAGTGGDEAALFAADLFRMYSRLAERKSWQMEIMSMHSRSNGKIKEVIFLIRGKGIYSFLKYESGVHRVQRVPETENQGRIHTSAATVAVLAEVEDKDLNINTEELRIDVFRSSGPGGQHVNKTESAVRITHLPTGLVVSCQDEKSQYKNKMKALKVLYARLKDRLDQERHAEEAANRKNQVGTGDRSERIRTYNFPQGRITDHRISLTLYQLENVMDGDMNNLIEPLISNFRSLALGENYQNM